MPLPVRMFCSRRFRVLIKINAVRTYDDLRTILGTTRAKYKKPIIFKHSIKTIVVFC